jgi:hypothetical protein
MDLNYTAADQAFRTEVRHWLDANLSSCGISQSREHGA